MLSVRCLSVALTLVHCGQTVVWIKTKLGKQVGLGPGHMVLDGNPAPPPPKWHSPQFSAHICCGQRAAWIKMPLDTEEGLGPGDVVLDGDQGGGAPNFRPMFICGKQLHESRCQLVWR